MINWYCKVGSGNHPKSSFMFQVTVSRKKKINSRTELRFRRHGIIMFIIVKLNAKTITLYQSCFLLGYSSHNTKCVHYRATNHDIKMWRKSLFVLSEVYSAKNKTAAKKSWRSLRHWKRLIVWAMGYGHEHHGAHAMPCHSHLYPWVVLMDTGGSGMAVALHYR